MEERQDKYYEPNRTVLGYIWSTTSITGKLIHIVHLLWPDPSGAGTLLCADNFTSADIPYLSNQMHPENKTPNLTTLLCPTENKKEVSFCHLMHNTTQ